MNTASNRELYYHIVALKPWSQKTFQTFVDAYCSTHNFPCARVLDSAIKSNQLLRGLTTNARCASFLMDYVTERCQHLLDSDGVAITMCMLSSVGACSAMWLEGIAQ